MNNSLRSLSVLLIMASLLPGPAQAETGPLTSSQTSYQPGASPTETPSPKPTSSPSSNQQGTGTLQTADMAITAITPKEAAQNSLIEILGNRSYSIQEVKDAKGNVTGFKAVISLNASTESLKFLEKTSDLMQAPKTASSVQFNFNTRGTMTDSTFLDSEGSTHKTTYSDSGKMNSTIIADKSGKTIQTIQYDSDTHITNHYMKPTEENPMSAIVINIQTVADLQSLENSRQKKQNKTQITYECYAADDITLPFGEKNPLHLEYSIVAVSSDGSLNINNLQSISIVADGGYVMYSGIFQKDLPGNTLVLFRFSTPYGIYEKTFKNPASIKDLTRQAYTFYGTLDQKSYLMINAESFDSRIKFSLADYDKITVIGTDTVHFTTSYSAGEKSFNIGFRIILDGWYPAGVEYLYDTNQNGKFEPEDQKIAASFFAGAANLLSSIVDAKDFQKNALLLEVFNKDEGTLLYQGQLYTFQKSPDGKSIVIHTDHSLFYASGGKILRRISFDDQTMIQGISVTSKGVYFITSNPKTNLAIRFAAFTNFTQTGIQTAALPQGVSLKNAVSIQFVKNLDGVVDILGNDRVVRRVDLEKRLILSENTYDAKGKLVKSLIYTYYIPSLPANYYMVTTKDYKTGAVYLTFYYNGINIGPLFGRRGF